jgi:hypothetical protein
MRNRSDDMFTGNERSDDLSYTGGSLKLIQDFCDEIRFDTYAGISIEYVLLPSLSEQFPLDNVNIVLCHSVLATFPKVYANFTSKQYMSIFAIIFPYTNPFKNPTDQATRTKPCAIFNSASISATQQRLLFTTPWSRYMLRIPREMRLKNTMLGSCNLDSKKILQFTQFFHLKFNS